MTMQYGAFFPTRDMPADRIQIRDWAQAAEEIGFDYIEVSDHVLGADREKIPGFEGPYDADDSFHETFTTIAYMAAITEKVGFASGVLILPQRQTALVAKQAAEVAILSNNRLRLGVGTGWNKIEYEALNEDFASHGARQSEQIEVMRALWSQDVVDFHGKYHRIDQAGFNPRPSQPVPLWFGGSAPALVRRCARLGDGWIPLMGPSAAAAEIIGELQRQRAELGKNWADFSILAQAQYAGGTPERWRGHAGKWQALGATHMAIATHNAGVTDVDGHLARTEAYFKAVQDV